MTTTTYIYAHFRNAYPNVILKRNSVGVLQYVTITKLDYHVVNKVYWFMTKPFDPLESYQTYPKISTWYVFL